MDFAFIIIIQEIYAQCKWIGTAPLCNGKESDCTGDYDHYLTDGTCGKGGNRCIVGYKVLCCNVENPFSTVYWKGTAPFCSGKCSDCNGDACILQDDCGVGVACWSGTKQLCGRYRSLTKAELEDMVKISQYTKAKEGMAMLMGGHHQVDVMEESDPGLVLAYVNYDKVIWEN